MEIYIGIDWSRSGGVAACVAGSVEAQFKYERSVDSIKGLVQAAKKLSKDRECVVRAAIEAGDPSLIALLLAEGVIVHQVDPKQARRFAESLSSSRAKDDGRDARNLAALAQSEPHRRPPYSLPGPSCEALNALVTAHEAAIGRRQRIVNQLRAKLCELAPAIERELGNLKSASALALIDLAPTATHANSIDDAIWAEFCANQRLRASRRAALREALKAPWRFLSKSLADASACLIRGMIGELRAANDSIKAIDNELEKLTSSMDGAKRLQSVQGIGLHIASGLMAIGIGSIHDRDDLAAICCAAPVTIESGKSRSVRRRRESSTTAARTTFLLGLQAVRRLAWGKAMYADGRARGQAHGTATRRVGRSMLRILQALLKSGTDYDDAQYVQRLKSKGVPWAAQLVITHSSDPGS